MSPLAPTQFSDRTSPAPFRVPPSLSTALTSTSGPWALCALLAQASGSDGSASLGVSAADTWPSIPATRQRTAAPSLSRFPFFVAKSWAGPHLHSTFWLKISDLVKLPSSLWAVPPCPVKHPLRSAENQVALSASTCACPRPDGPCYWLPLILIFSPSLITYFLVPTRTHRLTFHCLLEHLQGVGGTVCAHSPSQGLLSISSDGFCSPGSNWRDCLQCPHVPLRLLFVRGRGMPEYWEF